MSRHELEKSVRMFRKFSEETMRRRGGGPMSREGVVALQAIEAVLQGERPMDGSLLEPLAALTSLLQSGQLPPEFGHFSLADALLAVEEAAAEMNQAAEQRWEFAPDLSDAVAARLAGLDFRGWREKESAPDASAEVPAYALESRRLILEAAGSATPGAAVVTGARGGMGLPLAELAARFQRLTLNDLDPSALEAVVRGQVPEALRERILIERYDLTGSYQHFVEELDARVGTASSLSEAELSIVDLARSYDVSAGSAGLCGVEGVADFAVSSMVLAELGAGFKLETARCLRERGWAPDSALSESLDEALGLFACFVQQHHIQALLRRAKLSVLISDVSETPVRRLADGSFEALGDTRELLSVERLRERLPQGAEVLTEVDWERTRHSDSNGAEQPAMTILVEGLLISKGRATNSA